MTDQNNCTPKYYSSPKKKHGMVLNIGSKCSSVFGADQTPTPTRIYKNCEEVGLFQDLQDVEINIFDETFRKAVESGKPGSLLVQNSPSSAVADDTLHTPCIFPHIIESESVYQPVSAEEYLLNKQTNSVPSKDAEVMEVEKTAVETKPSQSSVFKKHSISMSSKEEEYMEKLTTVPAQIPLLKRCASSISSEGSKAMTENIMGSVQPLIKPKMVRHEADTSRLKPLAPAPSTSTVRSGTMTHHLVPLQMSVGSFIRLNTNQLTSNKKSEIPGPFDLVVQADKSRTKMESVILHTSLKKKQDLEKISPMIKEKLKARFGNIANVGNMVSANHQKMLKQDIRAHLPLSKPLSSLSQSVNSDDEEIKRQKFLERNRAAAMRSRRKRKCFLDNLAQKVDRLMLQNQQLMAEMALIKTFLLTHEACPFIEAAMRNNEVPFGVVCPLDVNVNAQKSQDRTTAEKFKPLFPGTSSQQNMSKKIQFVPIKKSLPKDETKNGTSKEIPRKTRLSLDIESAKQSQCMSEKKSPLIGTDKFLSSTLLPSESVATQVIQVNPNVLYRESSLRLSSPLLPISPHTTTIDYN